MLILSILFILLVLGVIAFIISCWKRVERSGEALIITNANGTQKVTFGGGIVIPFLNMHERVDLTRKRIGITRKKMHSMNHDPDARSTSGSTLIYNGGLLCKDNILAYMDVEFYLSINNESTDILRVVKHFTAPRASDTAVLAEHFGAKFSEALKTIVRKFDYEELVNNRDEFRNQVIKLLENDMDGFILNEVAIENIEQAPMDDYHKDNILEVAGLRKIVDITAEMNIRTSELLETEKTEVQKKATDGEKHRLALTRSLEEERARNQREIAVIQIKEKTQQDLVAQDARLEVQEREVRNTQTLELARKNQEREIEVAAYNNQKILQVQQEEVKEAQAVAQVLAEKNVLEQNLSKQTYEEQERTRIASIQAERTKIERSIVEEKEQTLNTQNSNALERQKAVEIVTGEAKAQAEARQITILAEARLNATKNDISREALLADNRLKVAQKEAEARIQQTEAIKAETAAPKLAELQVREKSVTIRAQELEVEAKAVEVKALEVSRIGSAEAERVKSMGSAEAERVKSMGLATADSEKARYEAMQSITPETREHELSKLQIEKDKEVQLAQVQSNVVVAQANASVMAEAMRHANIKMIGDGNLFDKIRQSIFAGESLDARFDSSKVMQTAFKSYSDGSADFMQDLKSVLQKSDISTGSVGNLALAQAAVQMLTQTEKGKSFLQNLLGDGNNTPKP